MAHHSGDRPDDDKLRDMFEAKSDKIAELELALQLGATGEAPEGKLVERDEGAIRMGFTIQDGKVVMAFGKEIAWVGFTPDQADAIADQLKIKAARARLLTPAAND